MDTAFNPTRDHPEVKSFIAKVELPVEA